MRANIVFKQRLVLEPEETFLPCRPVSQMETPQNARLQLQDQDGLLRGQGVRDGYVSFGMRGGPISTAAADGGEQHAAAPDTLPRPLRFLVRRRHTLERVGPVVRGME